LADLKNRRPLKSRDTGWARAITRRLAAANITPNQISAASVLFAALARACFAGVDRSPPGLDIVLLLAGAAFVQMRLLCNLFDGMIAVEAGRGDATGPFWNEVPDRLADMLILVGFGFGAGLLSVGWAAACLAVFLSYLRAFGTSLDQVSDYTGPMAKQHRMATVTIAAILAASLAMWLDPTGILQLALWAVILGEILTAFRRMRRIYLRMKQSG